MLNFCLLTPKRHILAWNRVVWRITRENRFGALAVERWKNPLQKRNRVNILMRNFAHIGKRNPLRDRDWILHVGRYPGPNHVRNLWWWSVKGFGRGKGSNFQFPPMTCVVVLTTLSHYHASVWYPADQPTIVQQIEEADETLFINIRHNPLHILHTLLPKQIDYCYSLRPDLLILNLPTIMTIEIILIECSFAIPMDLPNTCDTGLHWVFIVLLLLWHCLGTLYYITLLSVVFIVAMVAL